MKKQEVRSRLCCNCGEAKSVTAKGLREHAEKVCKQPERKVKGNSVHPKAIKGKH